MPANNSYKRKNLNQRGGEQATVIHLNDKIIDLAKTANYQNTNPIKDSEELKLHTALKHRINKFLMGTECNSKEGDCLNPNIEYVWEGDGTHGIKYNGVVYDHFDKLVEDFINELVKVNRELEECKTRVIPNPIPNNDEIKRLTAIKEGLEQELAQLKEANTKALAEMENKYKVQLEILQNSSVKNQEEVTRLNNLLAKLPGPGPDLALQLEEANQKNLTAEAKIAELTTQLADITAKKDAEIQAAKDEGLAKLAEETAKISAKDSEIADLKTRLDAATNNTEVAALKEQIAKLTSDRDDSVTKASLLESKIAELNAQLADITAKKDAEIQAAKDEGLAKLNAETAKISAKDSEIADLNAKLAAAINNTEVADLKAQIATLTSERDALAAKVTAIEGELNGIKGVYEGKIAELKASAEAKQADVSRLEAENKNITDQINRMTSETGGTVSLLEKKIADLEIDKTTIKNEKQHIIDELDAKILDISNKNKLDLELKLKVIEKHETKIAQLNQQILDDKSKADKALHDLTEIHKTEKQALEAQILDKDATITQLREEIGRCVTPIALESIRAELEKTKGELHELHTKFDTTNDQLTATIAALEEQKDLLVKQGMKLNGEIAAKVALLKESNAKLAQYESGAAGNSDLLKQLEAEKKKNQGYIDAIKRLEASKEEIKKEFLEKAKNARDQAAKELLGMKNKKIALEEQLQASNLKVADYDNLQTKYQLLQVSESTLKRNLEVANENITNGRAAAEKYKAETEEKLATAQSKLKIAEDELAKLSLRSVTDPKTKSLLELSQNKVNKLEDELKVANGKVERYNADIQRLVAKVKQIGEDHKKELKDEKKRLQDKIDAGEKEIRRLNKSLEADKVDIQGYIVQIEKLRNDAGNAANNAATKAELDEANAKITRLNALLAKLPGPGPSVPRDVIQKNERALENLRNEVTKFAREKKEVEAKLAKLQTDFDNYKKAKEQELSSMGTKLRAAEDALAKYKAENKIVVNPLGKKDFTLEEMTAKHARLAKRIPELVKELSDLREQSKLDLKKLREEKDVEIKKVNDQLKVVKKELDECLRRPPPPIPVPAPVPGMKKDLQAEILKAAHEALEKKYNKLFSDKQEVDAKLIKLTAELASKKGDNGAELRGAYAKLKAAETERDGLRVQLASFKKTDDNGALKLALQKAEVNTAKHLKDIERLVTEKKDLAIKHANELRDLKKSTDAEITRLKAELKADKLDIQQAQIRYEQLKNKPDAPKVPCPICPPDRVCPKCPEVPKVDPNLQRELQKAQARGDNLQRSIESMSSQKKAVEAELSKAREDLAKAKTQNSPEISRLQNDLQKAQAKANNLLQNITQMSAQKKTVEAELVKAKDDLEKARTQSNPQMTNLQNELKRAQARGDNLQRSIEAMSSQKKDIEAQLAKARVDLTKAQTENSQQLSGVNAKLRAAEAEVASLRLQIRNSSNPADVVRLTADLKKAQEGVASRQAGIERLQKEKADLVGSTRLEINQLKHEKEGLKSDIAKCKRDLAAPKAPLAPSPELASLRSEVSTLKSEKASISSSKASIQAELFAKTGELNRLRAEIRSLKAASSRPSSPASTLTAFSEGNNNTNMKGGNNNSSFYEKYLKYKGKYLALKKQGI